MRRVRRITAVMAVALLATGGTVAFADDEVPEPTTTTTPEPVVTIKVEDIPAPTTEPEKAPSTEATPPPTTVDTPLSTEVATTDPTPASTPEAAAEVAPPTTNAQVTQDETAIVTGTQVANADTGTNATHSENVPATGGQQPNEIGTGNAEAVGSDDTNVVDQEAAVVLTDQAMANLLQVALILNIGAALANSGVNGAVSTPGGDGITGAIDSGNATAVGNDMAQYITQAARANADGTTDDAAKQLAVSLWMGLATANSGVNSIDGTGTTGSGGEIGSGDASAIGNQSLTDVLQQAALNGSGTGQINVEQYATVMNIGFALANSGVNDISGVAGGLLTAGTSDEQNGLALDLFSMLLPALMQSFLGTAGSGTIGTGDATAIGNRSETYIHQLAEAAASGDGIASIIQDVLVANVGAAGANTGGNVLGGGYANLDPDQAKAVVMLAAFLSQMLALVHTQSASTALAMQQQGMEIPFGDIVLTVQGQMQGYDTTLVGETGQRANIRQVTIILSLGIAQANSGDNTAIGVNSNSALSASVGTELIHTGDANAANDGTVIICQRINAEDIACLAPPPPTVPEEPVTPTTLPTTVTTVPGEVTTTTQVSPETDTTPTTVAAMVPPANGEQGGPQGFSNPTPSHSSPLPTTGSNVADWLIYAGALLLLGFGLMVVGRRRHHQAQPVLVTGDTHLAPDLDLWSLVPPED